MLAIRNVGFMQCVLFQHRLKYSVTELGLRSLFSASTEVKSSDDMAAERIHRPIQMDNPYKELPKGCILCNITVDHKNVQLLSQFVSPHTGRIYGRHITGLCGRKQKEVSKAIKKAINMGFMSVTFKDPSFLKDPNICNIKHLE